MIEAHFENIRNLIRSNIRSTQSDIKIAVAWFTQKELFAEVLESLNRGVHVSMIIIKDFINCGMYGLPLQRFVDSGGKLHFVSDRSWTMHNKFCLFDGSLVITGSYNWTYSAETRNAENVILTDDSSVCHDYNDYFTRLWDSSQEELQVPLIEVSSEDVIKNFSTIYDEIDAMVKNEIIPTNHALEVLRTAKSNVSAKIATIGRPIMPSLTPVYFEGEPLKPGVSVLLKTLSMPYANGKEWIFAKQGEKLPRYSNASLCNAEDISDNSENAVISCEMKKYYEENNGYFTIETNLSTIEILEFDKLPCLPKGKVRFKGHVEISKSGLVSISIYCHNTKETKKEEIQLVEGEDFIIGK